MSDLSPMVIVVAGAGLVALGLLAIVYGVYYRDGRASIRRMRRWGMRRRTILKCLLGFHGREWRGRCERCGRFLP